jgi:hypothetical protein
MKEKTMGLFMILCAAMFFFGCELGKNKDDNSSMLLLLAGLGKGEISYDDGENLHTFRADGFSDTTGKYTTVGILGDDTFRITFSASTPVPGTWDQNMDEYQISYITDGTTFHLDNSVGFTLTLTTWEGAGGMAAGTFSGMLADVANVGHKVPINNGIFAVKIID